MTARLEYGGSVESHGAPYVTVWTGQDGLNRIDLDNHVLSISTHEDISSPAGTFDMELLPWDESNRGELSIRGDMERSSRYLRLIEPYTPISIGIGTFGGVMLGLTDVCDYSTLAVNNSTRVGLRISGASMGTLLEESALSASLTTADSTKWTEDVSAVLGPNAPILKDLLGAEGPVNAAGERSLINASIDDVAAYTLKRIQGMQIPVLAHAFGGRGTVSDSCTLLISSLAGDRVYKPGLYMSETTAAGFLREILDQDFYYFRMETLPIAGSMPRPALVIRPKPFDEEVFRQGPPTWPAFDIDPNAAWENASTLLEGLQYHEIRVEDLAGDFRVGRTGRETANFYTVSNNNEVGMTASNVSAGMSFPIYDLDSASRYKSSRYDSRCSLVPADPREPSLEAQIGTSIQSKRNRLFCWNRGNPLFLTGSIVVRGDDRYRVGDPIWIPWFVDPLSNEAGVKFWCTGVTQSWSAATGMFTTTLSLSRGHGPGFWDAFTKRVQARMSGPTVDPIAVSLTGGPVSRISLNIHKISDSVLKGGWTSADK